MIYASHSVALAALQSSTASRRPMSVTMPARRRFAPAHVTKAGPQSLSSHFRHDESSSGAASRLFGSPRMMPHRQVATHFCWSHSTFSTQHREQLGLKPTCVSKQRLTPSSPPRKTRTAQRVAVRVRLSAVTRMTLMSWSEEHSPQSPQCWIVSPEESASETLERVVRPEAVLPHTASTL